LALNSTKTFWNASVSACSEYAASLVEFENDVEVQGLIKLISEGRKPFCHDVIQLLRYLIFLKKEKCSSFCLFHTKN
jgi:hypothetical protein